MDERRLTAWLIMQGFLQPDQVKEALEEQLRLKRDGTDVDIIEVARRQKLITDVQVLEILEKTGYQPPKRLAAPEPSDEGSVEASGWGSAASNTGSLDSLEEVEASAETEAVSDEGELTPSMRVPAVDAAAEAKALPAKGAPRARKGMSSASYQAARRRSNSTLQTVLVGGFMLLAGLVILSFVGGGSSSPMTDDRPDVADVKPPTNKKSRADTLLDKLRLGVKNLEESKIPGESRKRDIEKLEKVVEELRAERLLVSQGRIVERLAMRLARLSGKEGPPPPPEIDRSAEAEVAWKSLAEDFQRVLSLSLQQPRSELQRGAELVRGTNLRKQVSEELAKIQGKGPDAIATLVSAPDLHPVLGVGGYRSILRACDRFPSSLRETDKWKNWSGIIARFKQLQRVARAYEEALRLAEDAAQRGNINLARDAFKTSRYASDPWFKAILEFLARPEVVAAFAERKKEVEKGGPVVRRRVVPQPEGGTQRNDWGANWSERFLALEAEFKQAKDDERANVVNQLVELLKETESLARSNHATCVEIVEFFDEHPRVFKDTAPLVEPLKRHHELYFKGQLARATGPATLQALDRWCADKGYEAWRAQLRPLLRVVAMGGKANRGREKKREGRAAAREAVAKFSDKRLGIVVEGFTDLLDWMQKKGFAPKPIKDELDAIFTRGVERAGDPVAGSRLRDRLARLEHKLGDDASSEEKTFRKLLGNVIKEAVNRSLKAVEKCVAVGEVGLAFDLFAYVLQLDPENDRAHKGLGHIKVNGKWLRRFLAQRLQAGYAWDSKVCWRKVGQDERYAKGEVYVTQSNSWEPLSSANQKHSNPNDPWVIKTEHFELRSTADLAVTAQVAERLEAFYLQLFRQYDLFFMDKGGAKLIFGISPSQNKPLVVNFYRDQGQFKAHANPTTDWAAGFYSGGQHASFFYASGGWTTLQHEIVHQILGETSPGHAEAWLAEGAAVYLEDAFFRDGVLTLGERQHHRRIVTYESMERSGGKEHKLLDMIKFRTSQDWDSGDISKNYRGAGAVVYFLCNFDGGRYRGDFIEYLRAAYNGQRPKLSDFFGMPERVLDLLMRRFYDPNAKLDIPGGAGASAEDLSAAIDALKKTAGKSKPDLDQIAASFDLVRNALAGVETKEAEKQAKVAVKTLSKMRKKQARVVEKAIKAATGGKVLVERLQRLQALQAKAVAIVNDPSRYPDADHGKAGQPAVDKEVKELTDFWNSLPPAFEDPEVKVAFELLEASEPWMAELGASAKQRGDGKKELVEELKKRAGCANLVLTPDLKKAYEYNEKVRAFNAAQSQVPPESREQVRVLNDYRIMLGLHALAIDQRLHQCAAKHSAWMQQAGNMTHDEPTPARRTPGLRAKQEGYMDPVGENVAFGYSTPLSVHLGWYNSSGHHRNMIRKTFYVIGVAKSGTYWTQVFGVSKPPL